MGVLESTKAWIVLVQVRWRECQTIS